MNEALHKKPTLGTIPRTGTKPCMRCQYGILDAPVDGKLNCLEAGTSKIKLFSKEEVEEMTFCGKMVPWTKIELDHGEVEDPELKIADKILGNR